MRMTMVAGKTLGCLPMNLASGAIVEICHLDVKNTHVPNGDTPAVDKAGQPTTWHRRVYQFLDENVEWYICGRRGNVIDRKANPARLVPWLTMDHHSGRLAGTPQAPGQAIILVVAVSRDRDRVLSDARRVVVDIEK